MPERAIDPLDFLEVDRLLGDDERAVRDRVRSFVAEHILPHIEGWFSRGEFPRELSKGFGEIGVFGMEIEGYGCGNMTAVETGLAEMEIEYGDSGLRSFVSVQSGLVMYPIYRFGSEEQRLEWLPRMATGDAIGCFALTEPEAGSDPSSMTTFARTDGDDFIIDGYKRWNTNGWASDVAIVWAHTDNGIRGFLVPADAPGVEFREIDAWSLRVAARSELLLRNVRVPASAMLPGAEGLRAPLTCLTEARYGIAWGSMGAARSCVEAAIRHATTRVQFGKPIGSFQLVQRKLVEMVLELNKGMLLALHLGRMKDRGVLKFEHVSMGKMNNARAALQIAREARGLLGATGITFDAPVIRHMNNLESVVTYEGTEEMHTLILGAALTGIRAFS
jgi:glutaryl-CoA dehydrogenase